MIDIAEDLRSLSYDTVRVIYSVQNLHALFKPFEKNDDVPPAEWVCEELGIAQKASNDIVRPWHRDQYKHFIAGYLKMIGQPVVPAIVQGRNGPCYHHAAAGWGQERLRALTSRLDDAREDGATTYAAVIESLLHLHWNVFAEWADETGEVDDQAIESWLALELESTISTLPPELQTQPTGDMSVTVVDSETDIPAEYRARGYANGQPLTVEVIADPTIYGIKGPYLSKFYRGPKLKLGRAYIYKHSSVAPLADKIRRPDD